MQEYTDIALTIAHEAGASFSDMRIVEERQNRIYVRRRSLKLIIWEHLNRESTQWSKSRLKTDLRNAKN